MIAVPDRHSPVPSRGSADDPFAFLESRIDYERTPPRDGRARPFKLDRMRTLLARLGNPQEKIPCVHIAGTKGKGSTAAMLASILTTSGCRTGLFTSPHVHHFEERIRIDGTSVRSDSLAELIGVLKPIVSEMDASPGGGPTFFELTTALAWLEFVRRDVRLAVMEVGLGGRLDATNLCRPVATAITSISLDHTALLGDTLPQIAREKAGILKPGVPVFTGVTDPAALAEIEQQATAAGAPLYRLQHELCRDAPSSRSLVDSPLPRWSAEVRNPWRNAGRFECPLPGQHQLTNLTLAVSLVDYLRKEHRFAIDERDLRRGLAAVDWPLRMEVVIQKPLVILDAAHNEASIAALVQTLKTVRSGQRYCIFSASKDKDVAAMLARLSGQFDTVILTEYLGSPRAMPVADLARLAEPLLSGRVLQVASPAEATQLALSAAGEEDLICGTGSFFLAGELRSEFERQRDSGCRTPLMAGSP